MDGDIRAKWQWSFLTLSKLPQRRLSCNVKNDSAKSEGLSRVLESVVKFERIYRGAMFHLQTANISCLEPDSISKHWVVVELQYRA